MRLIIPSDLKALLRTGLTRSLAALGIKIGAAGLTYFTYVALARTQSPEEYGLFAFGLALATILAIVGGLGQNIAVLRFWSEDQARNRPESAAVAVRAGGILTICGSIGLGLALVLFGLVAATLVPASGPNLHLYAAAALILPLALAEYNSSALRAQGSVVAALAPRDIIWRLALPAAALAAFFGLGLSMTGWQALLLAAALLGLTLLLQYAWSARRGYDLQMGFKGVGDYWRARGPASRWFLLGAAVDAVALNADTILVGLMVDADSAGLYFNAFRTAGLMTLIGYAVTLVIAPMLARFYHEGDLRKAQAITAACVWAGFAFSLLIFAAFVVFGEQIMALFGPSYGAAYPLLVILGVGMLADAATGPARSVMMMTGHERGYVAAYGLITLAGLVLQALVLPTYGLIGAAMAGVGARIIGHLVIGIWCITRVGIDPTLMGLFRVGRHAPLPPAQAEPGVPS
jgi:O-antigen/teichoic acid export membrane protein